MRRISWVLVSVILISIIGCAAPRTGLTIGMKVPIKETEYTKRGVASMEYSIDAPLWR